VADWVTISALATAGGTLVLAGATFASVRSANRAARVAERTLLAQLRPLLVPSRREDPPQKIGFADEKWLVAPGGQGVAEATDEAIYLGIAVRNVGPGIALLHAWHFYPTRRGDDDPRARLDDFTRLTRDIYIAPGDIGFWQGAFRDPAAPGFAEARAAIEARAEVVAIDVLYGDQDGGQRMVSRFGLLPRDDGGWNATVSRHWSVDGVDPR
jgi:hypothetical protein